MEQSPGDILFIEDNPHDVELTIRSLEKHNLANTVKCINDGEEAQDFLLGKGKYATGKPNVSPCLILLDLRLPKVDGLEILQQIRLHKHTSKTPVILLISSKEDREIVESHQLGINSYVDKPVSFESLSKAVAELGLYWVILNKQSD